jgi:hypothetical protein
LQDRLVKELRLQGVSTEAHGKPVAFYSDKHGVFRVNTAGAVQGDGMTQFGRSLHALR